jgi:hypothetical protein
MPSTTEKPITALTSRSTAPIEDDPASGEFMKKQGFRQMTANEHARSRTFFPCADQSSAPGA